MPVPVALVVEALVAVSTGVRFHVEVFGHGVQEKPLVGAEPPVTAGAEVVICKEGKLNNL